MAGKSGPRKLLVASVGVATINYVLAGCDSMSTVANLVAAPGGSFNQGGAGGNPNIAGTPPTSGNLPLPPGGMRSDVPVAGNATMGGNAGAAGLGGGGEGGESNAAGQDGSGQGGDGAGGAGGMP